jgi:hypothetical protein
MINNKKGRRKNKKKKKKLLILSLGKSVMGLDATKRYL